MEQSSLSVLAWVIRVGHWRVFISLLDSALLLAAVVLIAVELRSVARKPDSTKPSRRWLRFRLRTFFILLTMFAVWTGVQVKWIHDRREARIWIREHGALFDDEGWTPPPKRRPAPVGLRVWGEPGASNIMLDSRQLPKHELKLTAMRIQDLFPEATVHLNFPRFTAIFDENFDLDSHLWEEQPQRRSD